MGSQDQISHSHENTTSSCRREVSSLNDARDAIESMINAQITCLQSLDCMRAVTFLHNLQRLYSSCHISSKLPYTVTSMNRIESSCTRPYSVEQKPESANSNVAEISEVLPNTGKQLHTTKAPPLIFVPPSLRENNSKCQAFTNHVEPHFTLNGNFLQHLIDVMNTKLQPFYASIGSEVNQESNFVRGQKHVNRHGSGSGNSNVSKGNRPQKKRKHTCTYCNKTFPYLCHVKVHERVHTGEKPYSCMICSRRFRQSGSLSVHVRRHTGVKPYRCSTCGRIFRHVNSLVRHARQTHGNLK